MTEYDRVVYATINELLGRLQSCASCEDTRLTKYANSGCSTAGTHCPRLKMVSHLQNSSSFNNEIRNSPSGKVDKMAHIPNIVRIEDDGSETPMTLCVKACEWQRDDDGGFYVGCGDFRVPAIRQRDIDEDGVAHNFTFCPYCGGSLTVKINTAPHNNGGKGEG